MLTSEHHKIYGKLRQHSRKVQLLNSLLLNEVTYCGPPVQICLQFEDNFCDELNNLDMQGFVLHFITAIIMLVP